MTEKHNKGFSYDTDVDITVETETASYRRGALTYTHPSYGLISVTRWTGGDDSMPLFGAEVGSNTRMCIRIEHAQVTQDLARNWYYGKERITEVVMTPVQYAEMISNPGTQGVPCTITFTQKDGTIKYRPIDTVTQHIQSEIEATVCEMKNKMKDIDKQVRNILDQPGTLKKADKEAIMSCVHGLVSTMTSKLPFYEENLTESIERMKMEARSEIDAYVTHAIHKVGLDAINNPQALQLLINDKSAKRQEDEEGA